MQRSITMLLTIITLSVALWSSPAFCADNPTASEIRGTMDKATDFMANTVSYRGGYLWMYSTDLSIVWGEVPARKTQIWLQDPGTIGMGNTFLDVYDYTGDKRYLAYAEMVANAVIWGQHPSGGWNYFIDFNMTDIRDWYKNVLSRCWGTEEYHHYYGNCTFDDEIITDATRYLLRLYLTTMDPAYLTPLRKALDFVLEAQFPNGAWPQRYPLMYDFPHDGHADYTSYYTFNDSVIQGNVFLLLKAWRELGNEEYYKAARRGMDFVALAQCAPPQGGWAQQYCHDMKPAAARSYEPASISAIYTVRISRDLMTFYKITGDRRYLQGIPDAIDWLNNSFLPEDHKMKEGVTHAKFYEPGTNRPLYSHRGGYTPDDGYYWFDYEPGNFPGHYGMQNAIDVDALEREYLRVNALSPTDARAEYDRRRTSVKKAQQIAPEKLREIIGALDSRGAWREEVRVKNYENRVRVPYKYFEGITTRTYLQNMATLLNSLKQME